MKYNITFETLPQTVGLIMEGLDCLREEVNTIKKCLFGETDHVLIGVNEAAEILQKKPCTIYSLCRKKKLPYYKRDEGTKLYFYKDELYRWIERGKRDDASETYDEHLATINSTHKRKPKSVFTNI
jgi:excisionase family DNA binding protein